MKRMPLVFIGASTGGPKALSSVIPRLGEKLAAPVIVVQHMPPKFTRSLAERLNQLSDLRVTEAEDREVLIPGHVYIAPGGFHLLIQTAGEKLVTRLSDSPPVHGVRPSADVTLRSLAAIGPRAIVAVILTGMGRDGAEGAAKLKKKNGETYVIAESEETSVVFGMPKAAIETGKVDEVCALPHVASAICQQFARKGAD
ncbi:chemotaxis protein CheB [Sporolactobacillus sp. THM7-7]|nr:chemotaxis protein CheB [Sporolactobacillus sp. THM7-7]